MKTFDKKIKQIKRTKWGIAIIIFVLALITLIWGIVEAIPKEIEYKEFDKNSDTYTYVKTKIKYLTGPIIETKNSSTGEEYYYYIANDLNDEQFIVKTGKETSIPIYGKDVTYENIETIGETEIYGMTELMSSSLNAILSAVLTEDIVSDNNLQDIIGICYFDMITEKGNISKNLFIFTGILIIFGTLYLYMNMKIRKRVDRTLEELKLKNKLDEAINEYEGGSLIEFKNVKVSLSPNFLFSYLNGIDVIEIKNIQNVTFSKKQFVNRDKNKYITITTKDNFEYYIAPFQKKSQKREANELLEKIKSMIK